MGKNLNIWRESSTLILVAKSIFSNPHLYDYKVLCLKRSRKSEFMPDTYVFPGGLISRSDSSPEWIKLYEKFGFSEDTIRAVLTPHKSNEDSLAQAIAPRICAIRETFEECGILLCKSPKIQINTKSNWASFIGGHELMSWQHKVHDDSNNFLKLCSQFELYPDIWSLRNWSHWVTPPSFDLKFNSYFFLATFNQMPTAHSDNREIQDLMWGTPQEFSTLNSLESVMLPVPQFYEITRLLGEYSVENLAEFAKERSKLGCEMFWPYRVKTDEGLYSVLPGDDFYPDEIVKTDTKIPYLAKLPDSAIKHRILHTSKYSYEMRISNFSPKNNHIAPKSSLGN